MFSILTVLVAVALASLAPASAYTDDCSTAAGCCAFRNTGYCSGIKLGRDTFDLAPGCDPTGKGYSLSPGTGMDGSPDGWDYTVNLCGSLDLENQLTSFCSIESGSTGDRVPTTFPIPTGPIAQKLNIPDDNQNGIVPGSLCTPDPGKVGEAQFGFAKQNAPSSGNSNHIPCTDAASSGCPVGNNLVGGTSPTFTNKPTFHPLMINGLFEVDGPVGVTVLWPLVPQTAAQAGPGYLYTGPSTAPLEQQQYEFPFGRCKAGGRQSAFRIVCNCDRTTPLLLGVRTGMFDSDAGSCASVNPDGTCDYPATAANATAACQYTFNWEAAVGCPVGSCAPSSTGMSGGEIVLVVTAVSAGVYLLVALALGYKESGTPSLPASHRSAWGSAFGLCGDGCSAVWIKVTGGTDSIPGLAPDSRTSLTELQSPSSALNYQ